MYDKQLFGIIVSVYVTVVSSETCARYKGYGLSQRMEYMYCSTECCGDIYNRYCCSNFGVIIGAISGGISVVVAITITAVVCCCCCRKSRGQAGQVIQSANTTTTTTNTTTVYTLQGMQTTNLGYIPDGYNNVSAPAYIPTTNTQPADYQKWQDPPPSYDEINHSHNRVS